jgi:rhodanese-related sulfurtransferase/DNA-binding HxlR family transcriptional regulator
MDPSAKRTFKDQLFEQFARIGKGLASGRRLELLELLAQGERTVEELARETGMSVANTSQHLRALREAQLVEVRREGLYARYRLANEHVFALWQALRELGSARLAEIRHIVETYLTDRESLSGITCEELSRRLKDRSVVLLDVRPEEEYQAGHVAGARSIPLTELRARLKELPKKKEIVAYCRGPYCVFADEAVALLRSHGRKATRLEAGFPDWKARGLPVVTAAIHGTRTTHAAR